MIFSVKNTEQGLLFESSGRAAALLQSVPGCTDTAAERPGQPGVFDIRRVSDVPVDHMTMTLKTLFSYEHTMIPAVSYDGNPWGHDHEHKGYGMDGVPYAIAYHRCAVPSGTASYAADISAALFGPVNTACRLYPEENHMVHQLLWPEEETPKVLLVRVWGEPFYGEMAPQTEFTATVCIGGKDQPAWQKMLDAAWLADDKERRNARSDREIWDLSVRYAKLLYTREENGFCGFNIGLAPDGPGKAWTKRTGNPYEIGWCGQNASMALSLIEQYRRCGDQEALDMGISVLDSWCTIARSEQGMLYTRFGDPSTQKIIDACNMGTAGMMWVEAHRTAAALGLDKPRYLQAARDICTFIIRNMREDGCVGMSWNPDGSLHTLEGTAGGFLILPLVSLYEETKEPALLDAARKVYGFYYAEFARNGYGTAGALDTRCIDKESVIPLFKGALALHDLTGEDVFLRQARDAAYYLSTWQWHYSTQYAPDTILGQMGYDTFGGTAVSTSHHHIDDFALCYMADMLRLAEKTGESIWESRAKAIWYSGIQGISDGTMVLMDKPARPAGSKDEGYLHTRWGTPGKSHGFCDYFSVSQWLVAWPCAFRLEVLRRLNGGK